MKWFLLFSFFLVYMFRSSMILAQEVSENEILKHGFISPIDLSFGLYNTPVTTIEEFNKQLLEFYVPAQQFYTAYDYMVINDSLSRHEGNVLRVNYDLEGKGFKSYSFTKLHSSSEEQNTAILIIPGSDNNQSTLIYYGRGYHGNIAEVAYEKGDVYITVKPNEDILALHDGQRKMSYSFITNYMLNMGGSYSASYIINSIATVKYLQERYDKVIVIGLSQGGRAALLNSLQTSPDATVVASGFTVMRDKVEWAYEDQIIIPELLNIYSNEFIYERIKGQNTNYYFSWATNERGVYQMEAYNGYTADFFKELPNVESETHNQGHSFPNPQVGDFMSRIPFAAILLVSNSIDACFNELYLQATLPDNSNIESYQWYRNDSLLDDRSDTLSLIEGGDYQLVVKNSFGKIFATNTVSLSERNFNKKIILNDRIITAPKGYNSYEWYVNNVLSDNKVHDLVVTVPGAYYVVLRGEFGCKTSNIIHIPKEYPVFADNLTVEIYPNPNNGNFSVRLVSPYPEEVSIILYDALGKSIYERKYMKDVNSYTKEFAISNLNSGLYIFKAVSARNEQVLRILVR